MNFEHKITERDASAGCSASLWTRIADVSRQDSSRNLNKRTAT